jgi:hypothetical protein
MEVRGFHMLEKRLQRVMRKCQYQQERLREQKLRLRSRRLNRVRRRCMLQQSYSGRSSPTGNAIFTSAMKLRYFFN